MAQISEITGVVSVDDTHRTALRNITVTADDGEVKVYQVPYSVGLKVQHEGWGVLMDKKIDVIQTDWPALLYAYREGRCGVK